MKQHLHKLVLLALAAILFLLAVSCKSDGGERLQIPARGEVWGDGTTYVVTNGNLVYATSTGRAGASVEVLGMPWRNVEVADGHAVVGRVSPKLLMTLLPGESLPAWAAPLFPSATLGDDGLLHAFTVNGIPVTIQPPEQ